MKKPANKRQGIIRIVAKASCGDIDEMRALKNFMGYTWFEVLRAGMQSKLAEADEIAESEKIGSYVVCWISPKMFHIAFKIRSENKNKYQKIYVFWITEVSEKLYRVLYKTDLKGSMKRITQIKRKIGKGVLTEFSLKEVV